RGFAAGDLIEGDIGPVEHAPIGRRIGTEPAGIGGKERVQRIESDEVGAGARGDLGQRREIGEVADAEVACRTQAVELAAYSPDPLMLEPGRDIAAGERLRWRGGGRR